MDKQIFFSEIRKSLFGGSLTKAQVDGMDSILAELDRFSVTDPAKKAYVLATAYHETGRRMMPVREGFALSDARARQIVEKAGYKYAQPDPVTGHVYYGRGHVQITWADNYKRMGQIIGKDLYRNPDLALDPDISAAILVEGMVKGASGRGDFTGKNLDDYFSGGKNDPVGARRIINGTDKAEQIAGYHKEFLSAIIKAGGRA